MPDGAGTDYLGAPAVSYDRESTGEVSTQARLVLEKILQTTEQLTRFLRLARTSSFELWDKPVAVVITPLRTVLENC